MNDTHPLISRCEAALNAVGTQHSRTIHARLAVLVQDLANLLGVTVTLSQGMGAYDVSAEGLAYSYPDEPDEEPFALKSSDCLLDYIGRGFASRSGGRRSYSIHGLTKEGEAKLREIAELVDWLAGAPHVPAGEGGDIVRHPAAKPARKARRG